MDLAAAQALALALYDAGLNVSLDIVHPVDHPAAPRKETAPWLTLHVRGLRFDVEELHRIIDLVGASTEVESCNFSVSDGIVIR